MKRRDLLAGAVLAAGSPLMPRMSLPELSCTLPETGKGRKDAAGHLGEFALPQLRELYHRDLFADWLPFMERHVIDPEYGGFLCNTDFDGTHVNSDKDPLFEGRGIWVYSYLYTHFGKDARHLDVARRSVQLLSRSEPAECRLSRPFIILTAPHAGSTGETRILGAAVLRRCYPR